MIRNGAAVFPVGFAIIVLLGLELGRGDFAVAPRALARGYSRLAALVHNWQPKQSIEIRIR